MASSVSLRIYSANIGLLSGAFESAHRGFIAGGLKKNREFVGDCVKFAAGVLEEIQLLLFDPQTSGGLLVALNPASVDHARSLLEKANCDAMPVGEVVEKTSPLIEVI